MRPLALLVVLLTLLAPFGTAEDLIVIIAGQSNAAGAIVTPLPSDQEVIPNLFAAYTGDRIAGFTAHNSRKHMRLILPAVEPIGYGTGATKMGFARLAGIDIAAAFPNDRIILYMNALGSTVIAVTDPTTYEYSPPLRELMQHASVLGILFAQGETEASKTTTTEAGYAAAQDTYLASWRTWTGIPCLPLVAFDLGPNTNPPSYPTAPEVRAAIASWPFRDPCGKVATVDTSGAATQGAHYTHAGLELIAPRAAAALLSLLP